jgi:hypothetical protein
MARVRVRPTRVDISVANAISRHTGRKTEKAAGLLTWGADEHILSALAAAWWLYSRRRNADERQAADHILLTTLAASALPHLLKKLFDQERPDRLTLRGHWRGGGPTYRPPCSSRVLQSRVTRAPPRAKTPHPFPKGNRSLVRFAGPAAECGSGSAWPQPAPAVLALQLPTCFDMRTLSGGLVGSAPE